jgi:hypothetical protein
MSEETREATMNPDAVSEAKVFTGRVHYYDRNRGEHVEISDEPFVEVGKWTNEGEEHRPEDFDCTYYAALLLGYALNMSWLSTGDDETGMRKFIIYNGRDEKHKPVPFTFEEAQLVAGKINQILEQARQLRSE